MKVLLGIFLTVTAALYFTVGLRLGMVTMMPVQMFNAKGESNYTFRTEEDVNKVGVKGTCLVTKGKVTFYLIGPDGTTKASASCPKGGPWSVNLMAGGRAGFYKLRTEYKNYFGKIDLVEQRAGGTY